MIGKMILEKIAPPFVNQNIKVCHFAVVRFQKGLITKIWSKYCSAYKQSYGKDRKYFISCSFNTLYLFCIICKQFKTIKE